MPAVTILNPVVDEEPDETFHLDLRVSDSEDVDDPEPIDKDKGLDDIPMEVEDEILNKFDGSEEDESTKPTPSEESKNNETKPESDDKQTEDVTIEKEEELPRVSENEEETKSEEKEKPASPESKVEEEETGAPQEKDGENEDLLTVMEEKTAEADENEDFLEETTEGENGEDNIDKDKSDANNDTESNSEDTDIVSTHEELASPPAEVEADDGDGDDNTEGDGEMDIEECGLDTTITTHDAVETPEGLNITIKSDENKENEGGNANDEDGKSVLETILTATKVCNQKPSETSGTKRLMSDPPPKEEPPKKQKLLDEINGKLEAAPEEPKSEDITMKKLSSFRNFMFEKTVKILTREELEMFCMEKMCECIVQKSEIGELKMKIKMHEQLLDCLRKETVLLSKQTKDLNIVHQKVKQDVAKIKENSDKQLIVPKITRSVGLQAVVRDDRRKQTGTSVGQVVTKFISPITTTNTVNRTPVKSPRTPTPTTKPVQSPRFTTPVKTNVQSPTIRTVQAIKKNVVSSNTANGAGKGGVIDLTDEDDKKASTPTNNTATTVAASNGAITTTSTKSVTTQNGTKFQPILSPAAGQKLVVVSNGQAMIMKIAPNNVLTTAPNRTVQANGVRMTSQNLRGTAPGVRAVFAANRARGPSPGTVRARAQLQTKSNRHPAPLPGPPPLKPDVHSLKPLPPKPQLMLNKTSCGTGIVLSWKMPYDLDRFEMIASYQLYAYQETKSEPKTENWGKIGDVKALELPMAVTLTQFAVGNRYYFAVRAVDVLTRHGAFSEYQTILL